MSMGAMGGEIRFVVKVQNEEAIKDLTRRIEEEKEVIRELAFQLDKGTISEAKFFALAASGGRYIQQATARVEELSKSLQEANSRGFRGAGMGLLFMSQAIEDAQYGFSAIVNNIPMIVMAMGGSAGVAGAVSIAAVAVNQLIKHWDDLKDRFQAAWSGSTVEQLKKIREGAEEAAKAFDELSKKPTEMAEKGAKQLEKAMIEGDLGKWLEAATVKVAKTEGLMATPEAAVKEDFFRATADAREREKLMNEMNRRTAQNLLMDAKKPGVEGEHARQTLLGMGLSPEMMTAVKAADPAAQKRLKMEEQAMKAFGLEGAVGADAAMRADKEKEQAKKDEAKRQQHKLDFEREQAQFLKQKGAEEDRLIRADQANKKHIRGVLGQARDIGEDWRQFERRNQRAEFMGFGDFWKSTQQNILNGGTNDVQKRQLDVQEKIFDLLNNNPMMKEAILAAVAGNPP